MGVTDGLGLLRNLTEAGEEGLGLGSAFISWRSDKGIGYIRKERDWH